MLKANREPKDFKGWLVSDHFNFLVSRSNQKIISHLSEKYVKVIKCWKTIYCRVASYTEWKILYTLCKDKDGLLHKDTIRAVYDGSLFERMEKERASPKKTA